MWHSLVNGVSLALAVMLTLQGCGDNNSNPQPEPSKKTKTTTTTMTTTTTTLAKGPSGLNWCEDLVTFYKTHYDNGTKHAGGQCLPSKSPGAYYTSPGEKGDDGKSDRLWMCFHSGFNHSLWTDEAAKAHNFTGACLFRDYGNTTQPEDVEFCSKYLPHHPAVCAPGPTKFWGACWSRVSENWKCIPSNDTNILGLASGDCKADVVQEAAPSTKPTNHFFDGVCRFEQEMPTIYKCDTVAAYEESSGGTCGQSVDKKTDRACFSLKPDVHWQCMEAGKPGSAACDWTLLPGETTEFYKGYCVFPNNNEYKNAMDARNLTTTSVIV